MSEPQTGVKRYPRTFAGLIGSMIVLVLAVLGYYVFRNVLSEDLERKPEAVDYLDTVVAAQDAGLPLVYPAQLPSGWIATDVRLTPGDRFTWGLPMLTDAEKFVGIQQEDTDLRSLLDIYVDEHARQGADATIHSDVADTWSTWSDSGGDHAYAAEVGGTTVLVYGSAPVRDLQELVSRLTTAPVAR